MGRKGAKIIKNESEGLTTIKGLVAPHEWDQNNNLISLEIATPGEEGYVVEDNAAGQELLQCLHEQVIVFGVVRKDKKGKVVISVQDYEIVR